MGVAAAVQGTSSCRPGDEAKLNEIGFDHVLDRVARFGQAGGERFDPDRAALVGLGDHGEIAPVHRVEPEPGPGLGSQQVACGPPLIGVGEAVVFFDRALAR